MKLNYECRICNEQNNNEIYSPKEMMYGIRQSFTYFRCKTCGCLQISEYPTNIIEFYAKDYHINTSKKIINKIKNYLLLKRDIYEMSHKGILGFLVSFKIPQPGLRYVFNYLRNNNAAKILDVGCSTGRFLFSLRRLNFKNLFGIDPFIDRSMSIEGLSILKGDLFDINEVFNVIILNHSFEHMPNQFDNLLKIFSLLEPGGICILRIPLSSSYAFSKYKENWVQLDAPRHYYLHTLKSINTLSEKVGFKINNIIYDSTSFQFWGSEEYQNNKSSKEFSFRFLICNLLNPVRIYKKYFYYRKLSSELNAQSSGDQAIFFLQKI